MKKHLQKIYASKGLVTKFLLIGGFGFAANYAVLALFTNAEHMNRIVAEVIAATVALQVTFFMHDRWTYRIDNSTHAYHLSFWKRYRLYIISNAFGSFLTVAFFTLFSFFLAKLPALAMGAIAGLIWNFLMNKAVIWRHRERETATKPASR